MKKLALNLLLLLMIFCLCSCSTSTKTMPTREKAEYLFAENYELINTAVRLLWKHHDELDGLVIEERADYSCTVVAERKRNFLIQELH